MASRISIHLMLILITFSTYIAFSSPTHGDDHYLNDACRVTRHRSLCVHSLASFSNPARPNPCWWARASVSVTLAETERVGTYLSNLKRSGRMRGRAKTALSDCVECFGEAKSQLHNSLGELRRLGRETFDWQMSNVETWVSAALTYADTCLDGFGRCHGPQIGMLRSKVVNVTYFTSNALALVNKLASSGSEALDGSP